MKAISLWQPWATLVAIVAIGAKRIETRSWALDYTGPLVIHAAKKWDRELKALCRTRPFRVALEAAGIWQADGLPFGALIAVVDAVACSRVVITSIDLQIAKLADGTTVEGDEFSFGDYGIRRFGWHLKNVRPLPTPIPWTGRQGPFYVPDDVVLDALGAPVPADAVVTTPAASLFDSDNRRG